MGATAFATFRHEFAGILLDFTLLPKKYWGDRRLMWRWVFVFSMAAVCCDLSLIAEAGQPFWKQVLPQKQVEADERADYTLTQQNGPWLVLAATFSGEGGEAEARELVLELRRDFNLSSFYYAMTFERDRIAPGRGIDGVGTRIRRRYNRGTQNVEHAVLVGEFPTIDDPGAQDLLQQVKYLQPESLATDKPQETSRSLAAVRRFHNYLRKNMDTQQERGPLGHAFLTRNPLLPKEYFAPQGVDKQVAKWNKDIEYSLMKCPGRYSIRVATFRGRTKLQGKAIDQAELGTRKAEENDPLVQAVKNAHLLTEALRKKGWEAYEFHDRQESYVSVGSFNNAKQLPDGRIQIDNRDAQIIINTFGAMTPNNVFNRPAAEDLQLEEMKKQQFLSSFSKQQGAVAQGFYPKRFVGLPFDIHPQPVRVPRETISSAYAQNVR